MDDAATEGDRALQQVDHQWAFSTHRDVTAVSKTLSQILGPEENVGSLWL